MIHVIPKLSLGDKQRKQKTLFYVWTDLPNLSRLVGPFHFYIFLKIFIYLFIYFFCGKNDPIKHKQLKKSHIFCSKFFFKIYFDLFSKIPAKIVRFWFKIYS